MDLILESIPGLIVLAVVGIHMRAAFVQEARERRSHRLRWPSR